MFVRFRSSAHRLDVSLLDAIRRDGNPRQEHVASLGSIPQPASVSDRVTFWRKLHERLANLSNRVDAETNRRILEAVHRRIPMATATEQREAQLTNAIAEEKVWGVVADFYQANAENSRNLVASAERTVAANCNAARTASEIAEAAKEKAARIERGENVGSLGKAKTLDLVLADLGFTKAELRRMEQTAAFTDEEFEALIAERQRRAERRRDWIPHNAVEYAAMIAAHRAKRRKDEPPA